MLLLLLLLAMVLYINRLGVNLAAMTIALDYFQVLANFGKFDVHWGPGPSALMSFWSFAELNVEMVAPECFVSVSFVRDWLAVMALPALGAVALLLSHCLWWCARGRRSSREAVRVNLESVASFMLLMLQLSYLTLAAKTLQAFDCTELADGSYALDAAPYIRCWEGGDHGLLLAVGLPVGILMHVLGIPLLFSFIIRWAARQEAEWNRRCMPPLLALLPHWLEGAGEAEEKYPELLRAWCMVHMSDP